MSDLDSWRVSAAADNPDELPEGRWVVHGWPYPSGEAGVVFPSLTIEVDAAVGSGKIVAHMIVAAVQAAGKASENMLADHAAGRRGIDPRGWRYAPECATCRDVGIVSAPDLPSVSGHCACRRGARLLDLHIAEKVRDEVEHDERLASLLGGRAHPDDVPPVDPDGSPF